MSDKLKLTSIGDGGVSGGDSRISDLESSELKVFSKSVVFRVTHTVAEI